MLIAFYLRKGSNYTDGRIVDLPAGNTEVIAKKIMDLIGGDLFESDNVKAYPLDYYGATGIAKDELRSNARPELTGAVGNTDDNEVVYLGHHNWWGTFPVAVCTFPESYDFSGKTIMPFCTHEGSGLGSSVRDI
jgi:flavodoxin